MTDDPRCCGSGTCIIDTDGRCWCGQRWDGHRMVGPGQRCDAPVAAPVDASTSNTPSEALRAPVRHAYP
jgi:hypothetical protein